MAEAMALSGLLHFSIFLNIQSLQIYGDSKLIIDHVIDKNSIINHKISGWMNRIDTFWRRRKDYTIYHVDRSQNTQVDELSKKGLLTQMGKWKMDLKFYLVTYHLPWDVPWNYIFLLSKCISFSYMAENAP